MEEILKLLQTSQWSLDHREKALNNFQQFRNSISTRAMIKYEEQCIYYFSTTSWSSQGELTSIVRTKRERLRLEDGQKSWCSLLGQGASERVKDIYQEAIEGGNVEEFEGLMKLIPVEQWASIQPGEYGGATPLHWAALHGRTDMVCFIRDCLAGPQHDVTRKGIVDTRDQFGFTPLHLALFLLRWNWRRACLNTCTEVIQILRQMGATCCDPPSNNEHISHFLSWRSLEGYSPEVCSIQVDQYPCNPFYPIQQAIWDCNLGLVELLWQCFPETTREKSTRGDSLLHLAAFGTWLKLSYFELKGVIIRDNLDNVKPEDVLKHVLKFHHSAEDVNSLNHDRQTPLHLAVLSGVPARVEALLRCQHIKVNERNWKGYTPVEMATVLLESGTVGRMRMFTRQSASTLIYVDKTILDKFGVSPRQWEYEEVEASAMRRIISLFDGLDPEALHRERQVYVDAANAILVGAALIASASFGAWLQPPLGYQPYYSAEFLETNIAAAPGTYDSYAAIKQHWEIQVFWIFNSLSFFFSLATVIAGPDAAVPRQGLILKEAVNSVRRGVKWALWLLAMALVCVIGTFATIGFAILPPIRKYRINMYVTLSIGLCVCGIVLLRLVRKLNN